jgi:hypothetical protein
MKIKWYLLLVFLTACAPPIPKSGEQGSLSNPEFIGESPAKGKLYRVTVANPDSDYRHHYIYYFEGSDLLSINYTEQQGKALVGKTIISE